MRKRSSASVSSASQTGCARGRRAHRENAEGRAKNCRIEVIVVPDLSRLPGYDELQRIVQGRADRVKCLLEEIVVETNVAHSTGGTRPKAGIGHYLRDIVNGACDGVVTTLAVVAGATGAHFEPRVSIVLGIVNLAADGLSMGASNYLGLKSELEQSGASVEGEAPHRHGLATMLAFVLAGGVPLLGFAFGFSREAQFWLVIALAVATLAFVGGARSRFTNRAPARCALEMVTIAGAAAAIAYLLGRIVDPMLH